MRRVALCLRWCLMIGIVVIAGSAIATPVTFNYTTGQVTVVATTGANNEIIVMSSTVLALDGFSVTFDAALIDLTDLLLTIPTSGAITLATPYGGYDEIVIESADISPGGGYSTLFGQDLGGGNYSFVAGPLDINGVYSAMDSNNVNPDLANLPVPFTDNSLISASIDINTGTLTMSGITLTKLLGVNFGEQYDLSIKADIIFVGAIPEPGTAALLGLGLVVLAGRDRVGFSK